MISDRKYVKYILTYLSSTLLGIMGIIFSIQKLRNYMTEEPPAFDKLDLLNIILLNDDFPGYEYLSRTDMNLFFMIFIIMISGLLISSSEFLLRPGEYFTFVYSRAGSNRNAIRYMQGSGTLLTILYTSGLMISLFLFTWFWLPADLTALTSISEFRFFTYLILHGICLFFILMWIKEIMFFFYCHKNTSIAFLSGILTLSALILCDIQFSSGNIILFNPQHYFIDNITLSATGYFISRIIIRRKTILPF